MTPTNEQDPAGMPGIDPTLIAEIERDPKAFLTKTNAIDAQADDLKAIADARRWALAQWLHGEWNPNGITNTPGGGRPPTGGKTHAQLADMVGLSRRTVGFYIAAHMRRSGSGGTGSFAEAFKAVTGGPRLKTGAAVLRREPETLVPDIAQAMEKPEVAKAVAAAMSAQARRAFTVPVPEPAAEAAPLPPDVERAMETDDDEPLLLTPDDVERAEDDASRAYYDDLHEKAREREADRQAKVDALRAEREEEEGPWPAICLPLASARHQITKVARAIQEQDPTGMSGEDREMFDLEVAELKAAVGMLDIALENGQTEDWDDALQRLLADEAQA